MGSDEISNREELDKSVGKIYKVPCSSCDLKTNHVVVKSVENYWSQSDYSSYEISGLEKFEIVKCQGCENYSFRLTTSNSEDVTYDERTGEIEYLEDEHIYPNRLEGRKQLHSAYYLPSEIQSIYKETHGALCSKSNILAGAGIRTIAESVCKEKGAQGANLEKKIDNLSTKGVLTSQEAATLHSTRILGNRTVHEIIAPTDEELDVAMDIVENIIKTVYIIPRKAERLKK